MSACVRSLWRCVRWVVVVLGEKRGGMMLARF